MRLVLILLLLPVAAWAGPHAAMLRDTVGAHVLPRYHALSGAGDALVAAADAQCAADDPGLRAAWNAAFDAWLGVSHLRFGPSEQADRAFALAFWPDSKGFTPKALAGMIEGEDAAGRTPEAFAQVSIAGRGLYAMEFLLYDPRISTLGTDAYRCALTRTMARDIAVNAHAIEDGWTGGYATALTDPGPDGSPYRSEDEAAQELFKALTTGLQFTSDVRLGRPLGSFDKPRPRRAETWRAGRSLRNVSLSLEALRDLALHLSQGHPDLQAEFDTRFGEALDLARTLDDPVFAGVADPGKRLKIEILQQSIDRIRATAAEDLGPHLGVSAGFNALDGD